MANTQRTITDLYSVLPDNTTEQISPQDVRDIVETLRNGHIEIYLSASNKTTISNSGQFVKVAGTTSLSPSNHNWIMPSNNRVEYDGTSPRMTHVIGSFSVKAPNNNKNIRAAIAKNGNVIESSIVSSFISNGTNGDSSAINASTSVSNGDYLEFYIGNFTDATNVTVTFMNLSVMDMAV